MRNGFYIMLWLTLGLAGCSSSPKYGQPVATLAGNEVRSADNAQSQPKVAPGTEPENGVPTAGEVAEPQFELVNHTSVVRAQIDAGAVWLTAQILDAMAGEGDRANRAGPIYISTRTIRNQSKAQSDEFDAMLVRLADLLDAAGADDGLRFTADPVRQVNYHLKGTAYLVTTDGFDLWELYLSVKPSDRVWTLWQADAPVRLLRSARLRGQQLFPPVSAAR